MINALSLLTCYSYIVNACLDEARRGSICGLYPYSHSLTRESVQAYAGRSPNGVYVSRCAESLEDHCSRSSANDTDSKEVSVRRVVSMSKIEAERQGQSARRRQRDIGRAD